ncbi:gliding motility ABC transporter [Leptospira hartskeerlii]|uniref:Gliding motility ABC transporter n=1 Tax=Leptospira hartskeerlii TaxID=2023177 RepID=A0A2M9XBU9_9LEPT|nr:GldG family protein [Leptospira hartskeerlii]PJZ25156.1 gliding motility ABC transporter [Leptospira hartskeerlii]PJZ33548.1 gliding motility ABC transporter [Leptospira hartskeerlii]
MRELLRPLLEISRSPWFGLVNGILLFILLNGIFSAIPCKADLSRSGRFQITSSTVKVLKELDDPLYIDAFYSSEIPGEYKARAELSKELLKEISKIGKENVSLRFYDPSASEEDARKAAELGLEPQILQQTSRNSASVKQAFMGIVLTIGHKTEVLSFAFFTEDLEYQILNSIRKMQRQDLDSGIVLLKSQGNLSIQEQGSPKDRIEIFARRVLRGEYGPILELDLETEDLPPETEVVLWIGGGTLSKNTERKLDKFIIEGGSLLLLSKTMEFKTNAERGSFGLLSGDLGAGLAQRNPYSEEMVRFLEHYGIRINYDIILEPDHSLPMGSVIEIEPGVLGKYPYPPWIVPDQKSKTLDNHSLFTKNQESLLIPWSSSLNILPEKQKEVQFTILAKSGKDAESRMEPISLGEKQILSTPIQANGGPFILGVYAEGKFTSYFSDAKQKALDLQSQNKSPKTGRILVFGSPYLVSDLLAFPEFSEILKNSNIPFLLNAIDILKGETDLLEVRSKQSAVLKLKPLPFFLETSISLFHLFLVPCLLALYAFRRLKRRNG